MGIVVDLMIIGIVLLSTFLAYRKGMVKLAIGLCAFVISIVVTFVLYRPIANLIINVTSIDEAIEDTIYEKANDILKDEEDTAQDNLTSQIVEDAKNEMLPETARASAVNIVLADAIAKLPIINQINKTTGMLYGVIRGILVVYVVLLILTIPGKMNSNNSLNSSVEQSILGKVMYENNVLNVFF